MSDKHHVTPPDRAGFLTGSIRSLVYNPGKIMGPLFAAAILSLISGADPDSSHAPWLK